VGDPLTLPTFGRALRPTGFHSGAAAVTGIATAVAQELTGLSEAMTTAAPAAPPQADVPRAAFCFPGYPRSLVLPGVHLSIKRNLVEAFGAPDTRVFWYLVKGHDEGLYVRTELHAMYGQGLEPFDIADRAELAAARAVLKPATEIWDTSGGAAAPRGATALESAGKCDPAVAGQWKSIAGCYALIQEDERARHVRFDFVFKVRPDVAWIRRFPHHKEFIAGNWSGVSLLRDWVIVASRDWAPKIFTSSPPDCGRGAGGEAVVAAKLVQAKAPVRLACIEGVLCDINTTSFWAGEVDDGGPPEALPPRGVLPPGWQHWECLMPAALVRLARNASAGGGFVTLGEHFCQLNDAAECRDFATITDAEARHRVERWHAQPSCSGPCQLRAVNRQITSSAALGACEQEIRDFHSGKASHDKHILGGISG